MAVLRLREYAVVKRAPKLRHLVMHCSTAIWKGASIHYRPTVVIADDSRKAVEAVCALLQPAYNVIKLASNGEEAVSWILELHPDLAVLDICMPRMDGIATTRKLRQAGTSSRIVLLSQMEDEDYLQEARLIANGYVLKRRLSTDLLPALSRALADSFFSSYLSDF